MKSCPIPALLDKKDCLDLPAILLFFNKHYPDEYCTHLIERRGEHLYERIHLAISTKGKRGIPQVVIHHTGGVAIIISPRNKKGLRDACSKIMLGKVQHTEFYENLDSDSAKHYIDITDESGIIVRVTPHKFIVFSPGYIKLSQC